MAPGRRCSITCSRAWILCAPLWCLGPIAQAADAPARPPEAAACEACHGPYGLSPSDGIPNLAGQRAAYLVNQLEAFKRGERKNDLMAAVAAQLDTAQMRAQATYWSGLPATPSIDATATARPIRSRMDFPAAFPNGFAVYQTVGDIESGQVVKRYANAVALRAARDGLSLPPGAVLIVANHGLQRDAQQKPVIGSDGVPVAGALLSYAGMEHRTGWGAEVPALLRNGDWGYALFTADRERREGVNQAPCLACHKPIAADGHVFTLKALRGAGPTIAR